MSKIISSFFVALIASLMMMLLISSTSSSADAFRVMRSKENSAFSKKVAARREISERLRFIKENHQLRQNLEPFVGGTDCDSCEKDVGALVGILTNPILANITLDTLKSTVCAKLNGTEVQACDSIATLLFDVVGDLFTKAQTGGWNIAGVICADFLKKCDAPCCTTPYVPEQLLLSYANNGNIVSDSMQVRITWLTLNQTSGDYISFKESSASNFTTITSGITQTVAEGDSNWGWFGKFHSGVMMNLKPGTTYDYFVGSSGSSTIGKSPTYSFTTLPLNIGTTARPLRVAAIADIGTRNSNDTLNGILAKSEAGLVDLLLMIGDLGYYDGTMSRFATFGRMLEPISRSIITMTVVGNHEGGFFNFSQYKHRYQMPPAGSGAPGDAMYYTVNIGPVSMFFLDTETWFDTPDLDAVQMRWVKPLLAKANSNPGNFIAVFHHRPLYCSPHSGACFGGDESNLLRMQAEYVYYENKVDFVFSGHVHNLETMYPIKEGVVQQTNFDFPTAPVYMVGGNSGQAESLQIFNHPPYPWDRVREVKIGYQIFEFAKGVSKLDGRVHTAMNMTALESSTGNVLDNYLLTSRR